MLLGWLTHQIPVEIFSYWISIAIVFASSQPAKVSGAAALLVWATQPRCDMTEGRPKTPSASSRALCAASPPASAAPQPSAGRGVHSIHRNWVKHFLTPKPGYRGSCVPSSYKIFKKLPLITYIYPIFSVRIFSKSTISKPAADLPTRRQKTPHGNSKSIAIYPPVLRPHKVLDLLKLHNTSHPPMLLPRRRP